jgi:hypothetical protein
MLPCLWAHTLTLRPSLRLFKSVPEGFVDPATRVQFPTHRINEKGATLQGCPFFVDLVEAAGITSPY